MPTLAQKWMDEGIKQGMQQGMQQGIQQGMQQGEIIEKHHILIRLIMKKFGINEKEKEIVEEITDMVKLDNAIDNILFADNKESIMKILIS